MTNQHTSQVISVSRRTDIPAFYAAWFLNRLRAGFARYRTPFGGQSYEVSLRPEAVLAFVFWSRNYRPLLPYLPDLEKQGYDGYFHFTLTGLGPPLEPAAPPVPETIAVFEILAERYSPKHVLWRFDPMILSKQIPAAETLARFDSLARQLSGYTERCYVSFVDFYHKTERNLRLLAKEGVQCYDPAAEEKVALLRQLVDIGQQAHIQLRACCESDLLTVPGVTQAHCVDAALLAELFPEKFHALKQTPTRAGCGCFASRDIGAYNTCIAGCAYCYANANHQTALANYQRHDPESPIL